MILGLIFQKHPNIQSMLNFTRFAGATSVVLLALTTACSRSEPARNVSSTSNQELSSVSGQSSPAKVALANHLKEVKAKFYGTYWCPYCNKQQELFGQQAMSQINYIECDAKGKNPQPNLCKKANVSSLPTWEIKGQQYPGMQSLEELADLSGYKGDRNFGN